MQLLSILIPVYNEEKTLKTTLAAVSKVRIPNFKVEIVVVNDASRDHTAEILKKLDRGSMRVIHHSKNKGKGAAIRTALRHAKGDYVIIQDADLEYNPAEIPKLVDAAVSRNASVLYGSRFKAIKKDFSRMYKLHFFGNLMLTLATNVLYGSFITDMETCYKLMKRDVMQSLKLRSNRFDIEPEITAKLLKRGYTIKEVPISFKGRSFKQGKKITWRDGIVALGTLIKYRFVN